MLSVSTSSLEISTWEVILRLFGAMAIGIVIGTERELTRRPAGMRTHMLVSLGACSIAIMSQLLYVQYHAAYNASPDPARLSAQVIAGVGFLGAGTIMKEGPTVKGLTTAASLWCVACLGLAMGAGYYVLAVAGAAGMFVTLTVFETLQKKFMHFRDTFYLFEVTAREIGPALDHIYAAAAEVDAQIDAVHVTSEESKKQIEFHVKAEGRHNKERMHQFIDRLTGDETLLTVKSSDSRG